MDLSDNHVFICLLFEQTTDRELQDYLLKNGQTAIHYPIPCTNKSIATIPCCLSLLIQKMHDEVLSIPLNPVYQGRS
jgi:hypothetical protein